MSEFLQASAGVLVAVILIVSLRGQGKDMGMLLSLFVCCGLGCMAIGYLKPVFAFLTRLQDLGSIDSQMLSVLLKVVGIAIVAEIASLVCADAGNGAMGKGLQLLAVAVILWLSLPLLNALTELVENILGKL